MKLQLIRYFCIICIAIKLSGCAADPNDHRDAIAVSYEPQAWIVEQIAGDDVDIVTLLPSGTDPEVYQPSISTMKRLGNAKAYFTLDTEGFEEAIKQNISKNYPDLRIIDTAEGVNKIYGTHGHIDSADLNDSRDFDPHLFSSIRNSIVITKNITATLAEIYPENASRYLESGQTLINKLQSLDDSISRMKLTGRSIVIRHPSLSYYARDYGVNQIALSDVGKELSPKQLKQRLEAGFNSRPSVMVIEKEHASHSDYDVSQLLDIDTIQVALNSSSWIDDLMRISNEIDRN